VSFHETKNVIAGEGGALLVNDDTLVERAEIVCEKGTDRSRFFRGEVDRYTWTDIGSSYGPSEVTAAFLWAQLEAEEAIRCRRHEIWRWYAEAFAALERRERLRRPVVPAHCTHNAHMFYVLVSDLETRTRLLRELNDQGINAVFHYVPLHSSPAGRAYGRPHGRLPHTEQISEQLVRLPLWLGLEQADVERIAEAVGRVLD
jgi:dTDP-4-amino-4,6-dideoxygalactose transaminase